MTRWHGFLLCLVAPVATSAAQSFHLSGVLVDSVTGSPIANAHLSAAGDQPCATPPSPARSGTDGRFSLAVACSGVWRLTASANGYPTQAYEQHDAFSTGVVLSSRSPASDLRFRMVPGGVITGSVLDEASEPVRDAKVTLLSAGDPANPQPGPSSTTDDRGSYEFTNLLPGDYQVAVQAQPWYAAAASRPRRGGAANQPDTAADPSLDLTYPLTFFSGVTDQHSATIVHVSPGSAQEAGLRLSPIPAIHLLLPPSDRADGAGNSAGRRTLSFNRIQQVSVLGVTDFRPTSVTIREDGSTDLGGLAPGTYQVQRSRSRDASAGGLVEIGKDALGSVAFTPAPADQTQQKPPAKLTLSGVVALHGKVLPGAMLLLVPAAPGEDPIQRNQTNTDGSFLLDHLPAGKYILIALDHGWNVLWSDPAALIPFLLHGVPINLTTSATLPRPVEAQTP